MLEAARPLLGLSKAEGPNIGRESLGEENFDSDLLLFHILTVCGLPTRTTMYTCMYVMFCFLFLDNNLSKKKN